MSPRAVTSDSAAKAEAALAKYVDLARFDDGDTDVGGLRIHFKFARATARAETKLVLVHGLGLSYRYMMPTAQALMAEYAVYVPDLPGFGDSEKPRKILDINALADSLGAWLEHMQFQGRVALLGNSLACQIIAAALDRHPRVACAAILQGPTTPPDERNIFWQLVRWRQNLRNDPDDMKVISRDDYLKCGRLRVWGTFFHGLQDHLEDRLPRIRQPVLVVRGEIDPICHEQWAIDVARRLPHGRLVQLPHVAHTLVFTAPEPLAQVTKSFLKSV
jgi:2-hydroxy-6-oxonona-2,4-dienedioate hydrolase